MIGSDNFHLRPIRLIPRMDIKGPNLVKGIHLEGLRVLGKPAHFAKRYYEEGADELIYIDTVASLYGRKHLKEIVAQTAQDIFIPITVEGGIRSVEDMRELLRAGADKIAINTAAIKSPELIREGAEVFGSQCIVVSIQAKKVRAGVYEAFTENGRQETGIDVFKWVEMACKLGAGEIFVTSIDREGTGRGFDKELISKICDIVPVPVVACGGAGNLNDISDLICTTDVSGVAAASIFHYGAMDKSALREMEEGNIEFAKTYSASYSNQLMRITPTSVKDVKDKIIESGNICTRLGSSLSRLDDVVVNTAIGSELFPVVKVVDFGCGNLFGISLALRKVGVAFEITSDPKAIEQADKLILPGVGSFTYGMTNLKNRELIEPLKAHGLAGKPLMAICLGAQLLMTEGIEFGLCEGLNLIPGKTVKLELPSHSPHCFKVPHVGWNGIDPPFGFQKETWVTGVSRAVLPGSLMYFTHSYIVVPQERESVFAETFYGGTTFCSIVRRNNVIGCQFHPEKSGEAGLEILRNFVFNHDEPAFVSRSGR